MESSSIPNRTQSPSSQQKSIEPVASTPCRIAGELVTEDGTVRHVTMPVSFELEGFSLIPNSESRASSSDNLRGSLQGEVGRTLCVHLASIDSTLHQTVTSTSDNSVLNLESDGGISGNVTGQAVWMLERETYEVSDGEVIDYDSSIGPYALYLSEEKPYQCIQCGITFAQPKDLTRHKLTHTREPFYNSPLAAKSDDEMSIKASSSSVNLTDKAECSEVAEPSIAVQVSSIASQVSYSLRKVKEKQHICAECSKRFINNSQLLSHRRIHITEKSYTCNHCSKVFGHHSTLKRHKRIHTGEKPYKCTLCPRGFARSEPLKAHMLTHTGEEPYKCTSCAKVFARASYLNVHLHIHDPKSRFKCPICDKGYTTPYSLRRHRLRRHQATHMS